MLVDEVTDAPTLAVLLAVAERERRDFRAAQSSAEKDGEDGTIPETLCCGDVRRAQEGLRLPERKPVPVPMP